MKKLSILIPDLGEWRERGNEKACLICKQSCDTFASCDLGRRLAT